MPAKVKAPVRRSSKAEIREAAITLSDPNASALDKSLAGGLLALIKRQNAKSN